MPTMISAPTSSPPASPATVTILYPSGESVDLDYLINSHFSLLAQIWGPHGLRDWHVTKLNPESGYSVQSVVLFESLKGWEAALADKESAQVFGDVKNYTKAAPIIWVGVTEGKMGVGGQGTGSLGVR